MTQINYPFTLTAGQPENVNQLNSNLDHLKSVINGNLDSSNILDGSLDFGDFTSSVQGGLQDVYQAGVVGATHGQVTFTSASAVAIAAGTAWITQSSGLLRRVTFIGSSITGIPVATNLRLDQIVVDSNGLVSRIAGTDTTGVTLDNRTGAAALPTGSLRLGDLLITSAGVVNNVANIRDRRPWARGLNFQTTATAGDFTTAGAGTFQVITTVRVECSGAPLEAYAGGEIQAPNALAGHWTGVHVFVDGTVPTDLGNGANVGPFGVYNAANAGQIDYKYARYPFTPSAGSHLLTWRIWSSAAGGILRASATNPFRWGIREIAAPNANNGTA